MKVEKFEDGCVTKYVFIKEDACYEAVLYKYPTYKERTVLCISTQCGCPVGCTFCGTGKRFVRNLTIEEIYGQVHYIFADIGRIEWLDPEGTENRSYIENWVPVKDQIMAMSMGEPFLNYENVKRAITTLHQCYPTADLLLSSIGPDKKEELLHFLGISAQFKKIGLQFSIHRSTNTARDQLIPFKQKLSLQELRDYGIEWYSRTGRKVYLNYCIDGTNSYYTDMIALTNLFSPTAFAFTFSVVCSADETMKDAGYREL